ncbi:NADH-quinone oxidoreductase subunit M [Candidatus Venteria ishoeyi]|uniref:NADH-quinone oxidoreductase subunit M n=1 Tax=Candidatus Venteria ishoeyi TaxID=1899563 RepID=UPI0025A58757|nr:NADH-quinone oxidoreductase subunit M [Candidatus Venteria ishoeyi]MDM8546157.1 NADH-quinone oxidoreductase subunit M [Candidatus Venteria ishoeyi]
MFAELPLLSLLIWLPIVGGAWVLLQGKNKDMATVRPVALFVAVITFLLSLFLYSGFDSSTAAMQFVEKHNWIAALNTYYHLGVDGISMPLIILTSFINVLVVLAGWEVIQKKPAQYMAAFLIMTGLMNGVFAALDAMLFYVLWEAMLVPMFIIIGVWGGPNRVYAAIKFFLYTLLGSVLMLIALLYMYNQSGSFGILDFHQLQMGMTAQTLIFLAFLVAFAVKVPMWPVHTWLPDAHVEAPTGGSVVLAAIMLKMGAYGFLRFSLPITPLASHQLAWMMVVLSLIAVVYIGFVALSQKDMKKLIAYSSIAHMGFVTLGFFIAFLIYDKTGQIGNGSVLGMEGAIVQMISHGFISGALFLCVGVLYDRVHSRQIYDYGGVANTMPLFAMFVVLFAMANSGLPGTSGFVGEFLVILGSFEAGFWIAFLAATTLIIGAAYSLWMVKRVLYGSIAEDKMETVGKLSDINGRETFILSTLAVMVLFFGIWPEPLLDVMHVTVANLLDHVHQAIQSAR